MHETLDEFKFRQDSNTDSGVIYLCASAKSMYNVLNTLAPSYLSALLHLAGNKDSPKDWTEFKIHPHWIMHCGVSCS